MAGITALLQVARRSQSALIASDLGFAVAPRLNAAGRLSDMSIGIRCLLTDDAVEANRLAQELDALNTERRQIEGKMQAEALAAVRVLRDPSSGVTRAGVCLFDAAWHQGVVGLVASRVKERLRRPVIAFAQINATTLRGSARSIAGIHIRDVLDSMAARAPLLIQKFGGHAMAAGVTLEVKGLDAFASAFDAECALALARLGSPDVIETDGELTLQELELPTAQALRAGGPWGPGFPGAAVRRCISHSIRAPGGRAPPQAGAGRAGRAGPVRCDRLQPRGRRALERRRAPSGEARLLYRLDCNEYLGESRLQLVIEHLLPVQRALA